MLMTSWLRNVKSNLRANSRRARDASRREKRPEALASQVEMLEDRTLLSVVIKYSADLSDPVIAESLDIKTNSEGADGNESDDYIEVQRGPTGVIQVITRENPGDPTYTIVLDPNLVQDTGDNQLFFLGDLVPARADEVEELKISGNEGMNVINVETLDDASFPLLTSVTLEGGAGADSLVGSEIVGTAADPLGDVIDGGTEEDTIEGGAGNDTIRGRSGADVINGEAGDDQIDGGDGNDVLDGGADNDVINGYAGRDAIEGGAGNDDLNGGTGRDTLSGDIGDDSLNGAGGEDFLYGGAGNDEIQGGGENDLLDGGDGDDTLEGQTGDDVLMGGGGADSLMGGAGNDLLKSLAPGDAPENVLVDTEGDAGDVNTVLSNDTPAEYNPSIAINPVDGTLYSVSSSVDPTTGTITAVAQTSTDQGDTWTTAPVPLAIDAFADAAYDAFGNLYVTGVDVATGNVLVGVSDDNGATFTQLGNYGPGSAPAIATGPSDVDGELAVFAVWEDDASGALEFAGYRATALDAVAQEQNDIINGTSDGRFPDVAVGPGGSVIAVYQKAISDDEGPSFISITVNARGLSDGGANGWQVPQVVRHPLDATAPTTNVGVDDAISAAPGGINAAPTIDWDYSGGELNGRVYLAYVVEADDPTAPTDETENESANPTTGKFRDTDVVMITTDDLSDIFLDPDEFEADPTVSWTAPKTVHDDIDDDDLDGIREKDEIVAETRHQFMPSLQVDQTSGVLAITWLDARNDVGNVGQPGNTDSSQALEGADEDAANNDVQVYATVSVNGGESFAPNFRVSNLDTATNNEFPANVNGLDSGFTDDAADPLYGGTFGDYMGLAFQGGAMHAIWVDNAVAANDTDDLLDDDYEVYTTQFLIRHDGDTMDGEAGDDTLQGHYGNDSLSGGDDADIILGGAGEDTVLGGAGADFGNGGANGDPADGRNVYPRLGTALGDFVQGGDDEDTLMGDDFGDLFFEETVRQIETGTAASAVNDANDVDTVLFGNDTIFGGENVGTESIFGGMGDDLIHGDSTLVTVDGPDYIVGGVGDDTLVGGLDADTIYGSHPTDTLVGVTGNTDDDNIDGGAAADELSGGRGNDTITGGAGDGADDTIFGDIDPNDTDYDDALHVGNDLILWNGTADGEDDIDGGASFDRLLVDLPAGGNTIAADGDSPNAGEINITDTGVTAHAVMVEHLDFQLGSGDDTLTAVDFDSTPSLLLWTVDGEAGNDSVDLSGIGTANVLVFMQGGEGTDDLIGGPGDDTLQGGDNADTLTGNGGDDVLRGGDSDGDSLGVADTLFGNDGDDTLLGEGGADSMNGGAGNDLMKGGESSDLMEGGDGADVMLGEDGPDTISGEGGDDVIDGGNHADSLLGGDGNDLIDCGEGNDKAIGDAGDDTLNGDVGNDSLGGANGAESGDDLMRGGDGRDLIRGGTDADTLYGGDHRDSIEGSGAGDLIYAGRGKDTVDGMAGNDTIFGGRGSDFIEGGDGDDVISGQGGRDSLMGDDNAGTESGDDIINGGGGGDSIRGGFGNDGLSGRQGNDTLRGDAGDDTLVGGDGSDTMDGGADDDTVIGNDGDDTLWGGAGTDVGDDGDGDDTIDVSIESTDTTLYDTSMNSSVDGFEWIDNIMSYLDQI